MESKVSVISNKLVLVENFGGFDVFASMRIIQEVLELCSTLCINKILVDNSWLEQDQPDVNQHFDELHIDDGDFDLDPSFKLAILSPKKFLPAITPFMDSVSFTGISTRVFEKPGEVMSWLNDHQSQQVAAFA